MVPDSFGKATSLTAKYGGILKDVSKSCTQSWAWQSTKYDGTPPIRAPVLVVTGQLADCQLADWTSRGLDNSRSLRCRQTGKLSTQSRRWHPRVVQSATCPVRELSSPRVDQSARCPVRESSSPRVGNPRVGVSASCPVTRVQGRSYKPCTAADGNTTTKLCGSILHQKKKLKYLVWNWAAGADRDQTLYHPWVVPNDLLVFFLTFSQMTEQFTVFRSKAVYTYHAMR